MRPLVTVLTAIVLTAVTLMVPAAADGPRDKMPPTLKKSEPTVPKADEKDYKAALDRLPPPTKYDPWGKVKVRSDDGKP
jgi:hypothetical protein